MKAQLTTAQEIDSNYENLKNDNADCSGSIPMSQRSPSALKPILAIQPKRRAQSLITRFLSRAFPVRPSRIRVRSKVGCTAVISSALLAISMKEKNIMRDRIIC